MLGRNYIGILLLLALAVLVAVGYRQVAGPRGEQRTMLVRRPQGVMGTQCLLAVVMPSHEVQSGAQALQDAELVLRKVEALMSNYLADSEISRLCAAETGTSVTLSPETHTVLAAAREAYEATQGAFDVTCRPQLELWQVASETDKLPDAQSRAAARAASHWGLLRLDDDGVRKQAATAGVDLGGIAKGYAIDQALHLLRQAGACGGMVDVGGDLACFGSRADGTPWQVEVQHPTESEAVVCLRSGELAIATSGDYARFYDVAGVRYSHILDPRTCQPADAAQTATVIAPTAMAADVWATALSVLGTPGLAFLPDGTDALLIVAHEQELSYVCTPGFASLLDQPIPPHWQLAEESRP